MNRKGKYIHTKEELMEKFDFEFLLKEIHENKLTCRDIEKVYNIEQRFMSKLNKEMNLGIKSNWSFQKNKYLSIGLYKEDLYDLYIIQKKSIREIAKEYDVSHSCIKSAILFFDICKEDEIRPFNYIGYYDNRRIREENDDESRIYQVVMKKYIGRDLKEDETVHHIDFNRKNNNIDNLFLFDTRRKHSFYHGYIRGHEYIHPQQFLDSIYPKYEETFLNKEWLYNQYILLDKSIKQISLICDVSRLSITNTLKDFGLLELKKMRINQYDQFQDR